MPFYCIKFKKLNIFYRTYYNTAFPVCQYNARKKRCLNYLLLRLFYSILKNAFSPESKFSSSAHSPFFLTIPNSHSFAASYKSAPS